MEEYVLKRKDYDSHLSGEPANCILVVMAAKEYQMRL